MGFPLYIGSPWNFPFEKEYVVFFCSADMFLGGDFKDFCVHPWENDPN